VSGSAVQAPAGHRAHARRLAPRLRGSRVGNVTLQQSHILDWRVPCPAARLAARGPIRLRRVRRPAPSHQRAGARVHNPHSTRPAQRARPGPRDSGGLAPPERAATGGVTRRVRTGRTATASRGRWTIPSRSERPCRSSRSGGVLLGPKPPASNRNVRGPPGRGARHLDPVVGRTRRHTPRAAVVGAAPSGPPRPVPTTRI
jgi:hypothetical protein